MIGTQGATVTVVTGPFGAGKSTYIRAHAQPRELIVDGTALLDTIMAGPRVYLPRQRAIAGRMRWALIRDIAEHPVTCWIECDQPRAIDRAAILDCFDPALWERRIIALVPADPCTAIARATTDPARPRNSGWARLIQRWYARYEPVADREADHVERWP